MAVSENTAFLTAAISWWLSWLLAAVDKQASALARTLGLGDSIDSNHIAIEIYYRDHDID